MSYKIPLSGPVFNATRHATPVCFHKLQGMWQGVTAHNGSPPDLPCAPSQSCHEPIPNLLNAVLLLEHLRQIEDNACHDNGP